MGWMYMINELRCIKQEDILDIHVGGNYYLPSTDFLGPSM